MRIPELPQLPEGTIQDLINSGEFVDVRSTFEADLFNAPVLWRSNLYDRYVSPYDPDRSRENLTTIMRRVVQTLADGDRRGNSVDVTATAIGPGGDQEFVELYVFAMADEEGEAFLTLNDARDLKEKTEGDEP